LVNKRNAMIELALPDGEKASVLTVDAMSGDGPARSVKPVGGKIKLEPFAVTLVTW
jgi:hypothetical protein